MEPAWRVIRNVEVGEPIYAEPKPHAVQIIGIEGANRVIEALERAGYVIVPRSALKPFANFIEKADGPMLQVVGHGKMEERPGITADAEDGRVLLKLSPECPSVTVGDFRRARAALSTGQREP